MAVRLKKTPAKRFNETRQYCGTCKRLNLTCYSVAPYGAEIGQPEAFENRPRYNLCRH
jgi:hypothetical protein